MFNIHGHLFNSQVLPNEVYFGRLGLNRKSMRLVRAVLKLVEKNGLPEDVEDVIQYAEKILPLFGLDDEWDSLKYLLRIYYMPMNKLVKYYSDTVMPNAGISGMCVLIPNFKDSRTRNAVDIICECTKGNPKFKVFAPIEYVKRDDVCGVKYYPALEGPPDIHDWQIVADLGKPVISHSSPGGVRSKNIPEDLAKKYNSPGKWMGILDDLPIRLNLAHCGGRDAFVNWFKNNKHVPGVNWSYNNMMLTYDGIEKPGKVFCDVSFHERQTCSDYRLAVANVDPWWRIMFGVDDPLTEIQYSVKTAASWFRNVWTPDGVDSSDATIKQFLS